MAHPPVDMPAELASQRLILRAYRAEDAPVYLQMVRENYIHLYEFMPEPVQALRSEDDARAFLAWVESERQKKNLFLFGLFEKAAGGYIGEAYLANPDWHVPSVELGYFLIQAATGQGYATEASRAVLRFAFEVLGVTRVDLQCTAENIASQRVAERLGFSLEGRQRLRHRKKDGNLVDRLWYGLLRGEWEQVAAP